ncbi:hypothetical protein RchiOBHm_Chr4g0412931 [Rosa chinensis]|uniref:Uncharacterized protein n=1 Tax=Rosa chinensis TaxID=74649 RepID=A0A2P6QW17_ROSCH|nr:hypothetical protein RchiOBHm_Chr4g0412931 [Rosa chinensis]
MERSETSNQVWLFFSYGISFQFAISILKPFLTPIRKLPNCFCLTGEYGTLRDLKSVEMA